MTIPGAYSYFGKPARVKLGATLVSFDRLTLSYAGSTRYHISPLCGCWNEQEAEVWRGVTFATRQLALSRKGDAPLTAYVVTAPWSGYMYNGGPWLALPVTPFGPIEASFDARVLLGQHSEQAVPDVSSTALVSSAQYAILITDRPVHIKQFGDTPIGAWIPMGGSTLTIAPHLAFHSSSANTVEMTESYRRIAIGTPRRERGQKKGDSIYPDGIQSNAELPALDLLGKRTVMWTESPNGIVWRSGSDGSVSRGGPGSAVGLIVDPAFSARVTVIPTNPEAITRFRELEQNQILPQPHDWLGVSDAGAISLRIDRTAGELAEFDKMTERLRLTDTLNDVKVAYPFTGWIAATGQDFFTYQPNSTNYRYPPSPPARGFNVFGQMSHLAFEGATGSVIVGSRVADIPAPSTLEFRDLDSFKAARGLIPVAVRGATDGLDTTLTFSGVSEAWLNGEPMTRTWDSLSWSWSFVAMLAGIIPVISAGLALALDVLRRRGADA